VYLDKKNWQILSVNKPGGGNGSVNHWNGRVHGHHSLFLNIRTETHHNLYNRLFASLYVFLWNGTFSYAAEFLLTDIKNHSLFHINVILKSIRSDLLSLTSPQDTSWTLHRPFVSIIPPLTWLSEVGEKSLCQFDKIIAVAGSQFVRSISQRWRILDYIPNTCPNTCPLGIFPLTLISAYVGRNLYCISAYNEQKTYSVAVALSVCFGVIFTTPVAVSLFLCNQSV
jgi:hypothetical protein